MHLGLSSLVQACRSQVLIVAKKRTYLSPTAVERNTLVDLHKADWTQIPAPKDDGLAAHLVGTKLPSLKLASTNNGLVDISKIKGKIVVYAYPMTGRPDVPLPDNWDMLPGARGCTPQSCAFRDHSEELQQLGVKAVFGLSTQTTDYQKEAAERLHLPFDLLSDANLELQSELKLPVMHVDGNTLLKRLTMVVEDGEIIHVIYPVFPPDENAIDVIHWLRVQSDS